MVQDKCWEFLKPKYEQYQQWCLTWQRPLIKVLVPRGIQWCNCFKPSGQELIIHSWLPEREKKKEESCRVGRRNVHIIQETGKKQGKERTKVAWLIMNSSWHVIWQGTGLISLMVLGRKCLVAQTRRFTGNKSVSFLICSDNVIMPCGSHHASHVQRCRRLALGQWGWGGGNWGMLGKG